MTTLSDFQVQGDNPNALFTLKLHRGDGMLLLGMNWKNGMPPTDFVGFAIEYREPGGNRFFALKNRLGFLDSDDTVNPNRFSTVHSPIQKFRWVHFPRNANMNGPFTYRVTPVFMNSKDELSYGEQQVADIELMRETYPGKLNISFTRGYVSSQSFTERYLLDKNSMKTLLPSSSADGVTFKPTHPKAEEALTWMGFESRSCLLDLLDEAIADPTARVDVIAYDLSEPILIGKFKQLRNRLRIIIDDDGTHGEEDSGEAQAETILVKSAGRSQVKRQHMGKLQHNKMIIVDGNTIKAAVGGSTNFSWRGLYVQNNNAVIIYNDAIAPFKEAFENYWSNENQVSTFAQTSSADLVKLSVDGIDARVTFSPHSADNAMLQDIADDVRRTESSLFFSLAFLYQTPGEMRDALREIARNDDVFSFGISDKQVKRKKRKGERDEIDLLTPDGRRTVVSPTALNKKSAPEPFKSESSGGNGTRLHHKFLVIDFDKPSARVYVGSYNFSKAADTTNGENLFLIRDRRIAVSYMIEALRIFDQYQFRFNQTQTTRKKKLFLAKPPRKKKEKAWWQEDWEDARKIKDRELFA